MTEQQQETQGAGAYRPCFCLGTGPQVYDMLRRFGPDAAWDHFRNARIEFLKGIRELIDQRIEYLSRKQEKKGKTIPVE
jgi:hypothetical protein